MDDAGQGNRKAVIAKVVRQFAPSRIERQLLAQVFEFVSGDQRTWDRHCDKRAEHPREPGAQHCDESPDSAPATSRHRAGRAVA